MQEKGRHNVKPHLVLAISLFCTVIAAMYVASVSLPASAIPLTIGGIVSAVLFLLTRSEAVARTAANDKTEQLLRAKGIQEQLNAQLEQHRTKLKELISQMPGVVWEMHGRPETGLRLTFVSEYIETILGYSAGEWVGKPNSWMSAVHPGDRDRVSRDLTAVVRTGADGTTFRWIAKDGREVWVETHAAVILDERGEVVGLRGVTMDITARHHAEETLRDREARLQIALSAARMASWHWDLTTGNVVWDDTPYAWPDFVKRLHPEDQLSVRNAVDEALRERKDLDLEFRVVQTDNTIRWVVLKAKVFQGSDGRPAYISGVSIDVTERRKSAEALRTSEERYRLAARATNDAIWDWDLTTSRVEWNEGIRTLFGYAAEQVGNDVTWRFNQVHPDDRDRVVSGFNAVIEGGGRFWSDEYQFRCANGSYAIVNDRAYIEHDESGKAMRLIAAMTDVTRLKQAEREREQLLRLEHAARKNAESANRVKDEFIATLSHELRTPLTPILGWTQLLSQRASDPVTLRRGLNVIEQNARSQARLIDDLLDMSRIVTGKMVIKIQNVDLHPIIRMAVDAVQPAADAKGVRIEVESQPGIQLTADSSRLQQVFWNLLSNAIKFTPTGGVVAIASSQVGTDLRIVVRDNGEGIDPEFLPHVFDRFSQADSTSIRTHGGLGVGLAIVRYLVELHGGNVAVESPGKGRGATFTVTLPAKASEARTPLRKSRRVTKTVSTLKSLRLLVVDDEADVRELLALVLQQEGAIVFTAASSEDGLRTLREQPIDILISDIAMPEENGYILLAKWREIEREQQKHQVPAIALTAYAREEDRQFASEAGFEIHLSKPVEPEKLVSAIISVATKHLGKAG